MKEIFLIKALTLLLPIILMAACNADDVTTDEVLKEKNMFSKKQSESYVVFSPMEGVLLQDGQPLANAKIIRQLKWNGNDEGLVEEFSTDEQGHFSLPLHEEDLSLGMLSQFVASASIEAEVNGEMFDVWYNSKLLPDLYSETGGAMQGLVCDLINDKIPVFIGGSNVTNILTKCRWGNMPE